MADADACWATSLRRSFLTMSFNPSGAQKVLDVGLVATLFCKVRMDDRIIQDPYGFQLDDSSTH